MSNTAAKLKPSLYQIAVASGIVTLIGLSLFYSFQAGGRATPSTESAPIVVTENVQSGQVDDVNDRLQALAGHGKPRTSALNAIVNNPASALAQLHANMTNVHAQQDGNRMISELENQHQAEPVDATWSAQSEVSILSASAAPVVLQAGLKPQNVAADCRSRTCKISAGFARSGDAEDWSDRLLTQMGTTLGQVKVTVIQQPDGSSEVRMYGARKQPARG